MFTHDGVTYHLDAESGVVQAYDTANLRVRMHRRTERAARKANFYGHGAMMYAWGAMLHMSSVDFDDAVAFGEHFAAHRFAVAVRGDEPVPLETRFRRWLAEVKS